MVSRGLSLFIVLAAACAASAQSSRGNWQVDKDRLCDDVVRVNQAVRYRGVRLVVFRFVRDGKPQSNTIKELVLRDGVKSRTEQILDDDKPGSIAVDDGRFRLHYDPKNNVINKSPSLQHQNSARLEMLMRERRGEYDISVREGDRVADYSTYLITVKDKRGFEHRLWVDRRGKAILKREVQGPEANQGVSFTFTTFRYLRSVEPSEFTIDKPGVKILEPIDRLVAAASKLELRPYRIVGDPKFQLYESFGLDRRGEKSLRSTYGDGKVVVSLVQVQGDLDPEKLKKEGLTVHVWKKDGYAFALMGSLTASELERLAKLVRR